MNGPSRTKTVSAPSSTSDVLALAPPQPAEIVTRRPLPETTLGRKHGIVKVALQTKSDDARRSIVTRRQGTIRSRRRKRLLTGLAIALAVFPPMWAVYLITFLVWRSRAPQKSMRQVRKAVRALEKEHTGVALKHLQEAHYLDPSNSDALYWLGLVLHQQGRQEEAEDALSLVAERVPGLPEVESALVDTYVAMGQPENAIYHAQRLLEAAPYAPETMLKLADAFEADGKPALAIQALEQAPLHKPTLTNALVQIHYRLGTFYEQQGNPAQALHHLHRVYARDITYRDVRSRVQALEDVQGE